MGTILPVVECLTLGTFLKLVGKITHHESKFSQALKDEVKRRLLEIEATIKLQHPKQKDSDLSRERMATVLSVEICTLCNELRNLLLGQATSGSTEEFEFRCPDLNPDDPWGKYPSPF